MSTKQLNTRIALKFDSYNNWKDSTLELLPGEVAICEVPGAPQTLADGTVVQTAPTVLFKVGTEEKKAFKDLPWASAKAADVYEWAKAETVELKINTVKNDKDEDVETGRSLVFKTGNTVLHEVDLSGFATDAELAAVETTISSRLSEIEASLGLSDTTVDGSIAKHR